MGGMFNRTGALCGLSRKAAVNPGLVLRKRSGRNRSGRHEKTRSTIGANVLLDGCPCAQHLGIGENHGYQRLGLLDPLSENEATENWWFFPPPSDAVSRPLTQALGKSHFFIKDLVTWYILGWTPRLRAGAKFG